MDVILCFIILGIQPADFYYSLNEATEDVDTIMNDFNNVMDNVVERIAFDMRGKWKAKNAV